MRSVDPAMSLAKFSVKQVVLVNLLFLVFVLAGAIIYRLLPVDVYPDLSLDEAWIQTFYPGAPPEDVEQHVTKKIEEELEDISGVDRIVSHSVANLSNIHIKFREDLNRSDYEAAFQEVRNRMDRVVDLPDLPDGPILTRLTLAEVWPIVQVVIAGERQVEEKVLREVTLNLKDKLKTVAGVAKIKETGVRDREIHLLVDKHALEQYQLSLLEVAAILQNSNINIPGGPIQTTEEELSLRAVGNVQNPEELGEICIKKSPTGAHVYLKDIALIEEHFERRIIMASYAGKPCLFLYIAKHRDADSITVRNRVEAALVEYRKGNLPPGVSVELFADSTQMIASRLSVLKKNLGVGIILVFLVLWMVIGARNAILAIVGIPFSFLCAFIFMYAVDVSINAVSVFALVLVSGMIVDDAIVVLENIYRHLQEGKPVKEAIVLGVDQVMWPVISSALTTVAAFMPLLIMTGVIGSFFAIIPKTVTVALLASLFECLIVLPAHFLHWGPRSWGRVQPHRGVSAQSRSPNLFSRLGQQVLAAYRAVLEQTLRFRYLCLGIIVVLGICAYQAQRTLTIELFPSDFPTMVTSFNIASGASLEKTNQTATKIMPLFTEFEDDGYVKSTSSVAGMQVDEDNQMRLQTNLAQIWIELEQAATKNYDPEAVMRQIRKKLVTFIDAHAELNIENMKIWAIQDGPPLGKPVAIRIEHPDYSVAGQIARQVKERLNNMKGVSDVSDIFDTGPRELRMVLKEDAASEFGLTLKQVSSTLAGANEGFVVGSFKDRLYDEDLDIRLKYQEVFRNSEDQFLDVDIKAPTGALIKLGQVADLSYEQSYASHYRFNGKRAVVVTADVDKRVTDGQRVTKSILKEFGPLATSNDQLTIVPAGQFKETYESFSSLFDAALVAICIMYLILAAQFKSYSQPLIILSALGFGALGLIMGLVVNQYPFSVVSGIALVGLFGVVVNDAIVLVSFINEERGKRDSLWEALISASMVRARPIILTTVTTVFGLLPMALGIGGYNKVWSPFATSICWGLGSATFMILIFLPPFYVIISDLNSWWSRTLSKDVGVPQSAS